MRFERHSRRTRVTHGMATLRVSRPLTGGRRTLVIHRGPCQGVLRCRHVFLFAGGSRVDQPDVKSREVPPVRRSARVILGTRPNFHYAPRRPAFIGSRCSRGFMGGIARVLSELWDTKYRAGDDLHQVWLQLERSRCAEVQGDDADESAATNGTGCTTVGPIACPAAPAHGHGYGRASASRARIRSDGCSSTDARIRRRSRPCGHGRWCAPRGPWTYGWAWSHARNSCAPWISTARWSTSAVRAKPGFGKYGRLR